MTLALLKPTTRASLLESGRAGKSVLFTREYINEIARLHSRFAVVARAHRS
ncbi:MAG TPA: hypothetical protein VI282_17695 [Verrucomicrobiae bacterium]